MAKFLQQEKLIQIEWKSKTSHLSLDAKKEGIFKNGITYPFFLPSQTSYENLFYEIREKAIFYFKNHGIEWHDNNGEAPSSHLCDSQVCCVNFLLPLTFSKEITLSLFKRYFPTINKVLNMDDDSFVSFEWIGKENYLKERLIPGTERTRGANCTSVDASIMFETETGKRIIVLIEWKYTESYTTKSYKIARSGRDRTTIYKHLWDKETCPIDKSKVVSFDSLFFEPFYQFTRQQFLAQEMEMARELGADEVFLMHISPKANEDFKTITSKELNGLSDSATGTWKECLKETSKFIPVYIEDFFDSNIITKDKKMQNYWEYISERYGSIVKK
jgi:hypothetical protein